MAFTSIWDMSTTAASNTSVQGNNIAEGCAPSSVNDAMRAMVAQTKGAVTSVTAAGTDTYTATLAPAPDALTDGMTIQVRFTNANTSTTPTLNINSLGAKTITKNGGSALLAGDIPAGHDAILRYVLGSTTWQLLNPKQAPISSIADATNGGMTVTNGTGPAVTLTLNVNDLTSKATPTTSDSVAIVDAAASSVTKKSTISALRTTVLTGSVVQLVSTESGTAASGSTVIPFDNTIPQNTEGDQYFSLAITPTNASSKLVIEFNGLFGTAGAAVELGVALFQDTTAGALAATACLLGTSSGGDQVTLRHVMTAGTTSATTFKVRAGPASSQTVQLNGNGTQLFGGVAASSLTITEILP